MRIQFRQPDLPQEAVSPVQGAMRHARTPRISLLTFLAPVVFFLALGYGVYLLLYSGKVYTYGIVASHTETFAAPYAGKVTKTAAERGRRVHKGDLLFRLEPLASTSGSSEPAGKLQEELAALEKSRAEEQAQRIQVAEAEVKRQEALLREETARQEHAKQSAQLEVERLRTMVAQRQDRLAKTQRLKDLEAGIQADVDTAARELEMARFDLRQAQTDATLAQQPMESAQAALTRAQAELEQARTTRPANLAIERLQLEMAQQVRELEPVEYAAPMDGIVLDLTVGEGSVVAAGNTLISVAAVDKVWIDAYVEVKHLADLRLDTPVRVFAPGESQAMEGRISEMPSTIIRIPPELQYEFGSVFSAGYLRVETATSEALIPGAVVHVVIP